MHNRYHSIFPRTLYMPHTHTIYHIWKHRFLLFFFKRYYFPYTLHQWKVGRQIQAVRNLYCFLLTRRSRRVRRGLKSPYRERTWNFSINFVLIFSQLKSSLNGLPYLFMCKTRSIQRQYTLLETYFYLFIVFITYIGVCFIV